jgi:predicted nucleotidyltransferase
MKYFWTNWKKKTEQEKRYIESLKRALQWLEEQPFKKDIISVYVKGSFVYREINEKSDIDLVTVMRDEKSLDLIRKIRDPNKEMLKPVDILPIGLEELENNKYFKEPLPGTRGKPDQFTLLISQNRLVYGKPLNTRGWKVRTDQKIYEALRNVIRDVQIGMYEKGEFGFGQLIKQVMHLIWWEERLKSRTINSSWRAMQEACPDNKLLQQTVFFRFNPTKDEVVRRKYIQQLKEYITS